MKDIIINDKYRVDRKIGQGGFGLVYSGTDLKSGEEVALKLVHHEVSPELNRNELEAYEALAGVDGIPTALWHGYECDYYVLAQDLLGPSLEDLFSYCDCKLSLKTVLLIAQQAIVRLQKIHNKDFLHRDIKPANFVMGIGRNGNKLYLLDFSLATRLSDAEELQHHEGRPFGGTATFASINCHKRKEQSRGDDLESLGYMLLYLLRGSLPWQGQEDDQRDDEWHKMMKEKKMGFTEEILSEGLPEEFARYITYTRSLGFDKPDYKFLIRLFQRLFKSRGFKYDLVFDWTEKRFHELHAQGDEAASEGDRD